MRGHRDVTIGQQRVLLSIARSPFYHTPLGEPDENRTPMRRIDVQVPETPFLGVRHPLDRLLCNRLSVMVQALSKAIHRFGPPDILNVDQGSEFTLFAWTDRLCRSPKRISPSCLYTCTVGQWMDGKGRDLDNILTLVVC